MVRKGGCHFFEYPFMYSSDFWTMWIFPELEKKRINNINKDWGSKMEYKYKQKLKNQAQYQINDITTLKGGQRDEKN